MLSEALGKHEGAADGQNEALEATSGTSAGASKQGLLPAFGLHKLSQLPTPQSSPNNMAAYAPNPNAAYSSPVSNSNRDLPMSQVQAPKAATPRRDNLQIRAPAPASFMTPDSSPVLPRKIMQPETPTAGPSSIPHTPVRALRERGGSSRAGSVASEVTNDMAVDAASPPLVPAPVISTPVSSSHSRAMTPASRLSSPFQSRLSAGDRRTANSQSKSPMPPGSPAAKVFDASPATPPPLASPVPQRALGGEIQRIHLQLAADRAELISEKEARRPEYLLRQKRPRSEADIPTLDELDAADAALGVTESPVKGRRLQLFQATSEETFEQSLLAGGYPGYGQSPAYQNSEPQTPTSKGRNALSQRAMQWLQQATPGQPGPSTVAEAVKAAPSEEPEYIPSEKEVRKRKRLEAFKDGREKEASTKLYPVEVEGRGRLLLNVPPEGMVALPDTPVKKRVTRRKRRRGGRRGQAEAPEEVVVQPNWLDSAFPWSLRAQERTHTEKMEEEERLKWIERFLDRDSESDSGEEEQELRPPLQSHENDQVAHRRGRGKMVPVRVNPDGAARAGGSENVLVPSDPADARAALLSKRSVRSLAVRRRQGRDDEVDEVKCMGCKRGDDDSDLVQCDECHTWYHLPCIGIKNVSELGREEDPWYCNKCLDITPSSPLAEPTFVPTDDQPLDSASHQDSFFLQEPLLESPAPHWDSELREPQTPVRGSSVRDGTYTRSFSTRSSWGDSSRGGPSTPDSTARTVRVYNTPGPFALAFDRDGFDPETPFDPTTTPSRGIKFSGGPPPTLGLSTPKGGFGWTGPRAGHTPTPAKFGERREGWQRQSWEDHANGSYSSSYPRSIYSNTVYSNTVEDTPVTRAPRFTALSAGGRRLWDDSHEFARPARPRTPPSRAGTRGERDPEGDVMMETEA
ncbi:hypothetical protein OH76DRAFT_1435380 [Lentinus brumalis]|uniref:PHD-type domain-containing protein n=1 Tax=Lentinus brumalis TaxID=2498619 RepID=A0A371DFY5_9APHY|nr:hypothetical protein OH76DRAFT_1435380 [Polyporus brumalis]